MSQDADDDICEPEEGNAVEEVDDMRMSRTMEPEYSVNFNKIRDKMVFDGMGNQIRFGDIYAKQKTVIIFIRNFLDFVTQDYVEDLGLIPVEYLQEADVRLVVIGCAPYKFINNFKQSIKYNYTLYCDPEREIYSILGLSAKFEHASVRSNKHVKQNAVMGVLRGMWRIMRSQEWEGDNKQNGGSFIIGPGEEVHFSHIDKNQVDQIPINELLERAGVQPVSFPRDPRVLKL
ncbi:peroxiredoxin-like 2C [Dreissena polymorpha]|uniref:Thioredoxin-like protein AAED1 n=1 Tax=Dreissena polymorpha TaxID=45954 RepID=A0A9D4IK84_DREPO|nr:peroxiredoxin-like 2C [Dreissena polymorpha]KAH3775687.1 hypothetical protein DPMN_177093 [Dreissena polymorpha]